jgi:hypothetical protein
VNGARSSIPACRRRSPGLQGRGTRAVGHPAGMTGLFDLCELVRPWAGLSEDLFGDLGFERRYAADMDASKTIRCRPVPHTSRRGPSLRPHPGGTTKQAAARPAERGIKTMIGILGAEVSSLRAAGLASPALTFRDHERSPPVRALVRRRLPVRPPVRRPPAIPRPRPVTPCLERASRQ